MNTKQQIELDARYSNWNGWYMDTFEHIKSIRNIGGNLLLEPKDNIHRYYSGVLNIFSTHSSYITDEKKIKKQLDKIQDKIYSKDFHTNLKEDVINAETVKVIKELIDIFTHINNSFSRHGITPKINKKVIDDPGDAIIKSEY